MSRSLSVVMAAIAVMALALLGGAYFTTAAGDSYPDPAVQPAE